MHDELVLFTQAGLTPLEVLQSANINAAECLYAIDSIGTVDVGMIADLILLDGNPLENIRNTSKIYAVILNGRYLHRGILNSMLGKGERGNVKLE